MLRDINRLIFILLVCTVSTPVMGNGVGVGNGGKAVYTSFMTKNYASEPQLLTATNLMLDQNVLLADPIVKKIIKLGQCNKNIAELRRFYVKSHYKPTNNFYLKKSFQGAIILRLENCKKPSNLNKVKPQ